MLVIRIDAEKNKETFHAVVAALAEFDVIDVAWEKSHRPRSAPRSGDDLGAHLSNAINRASRE